MQSSPFAKHSGTEGQTKKYKGKIYYYCPKEHSNGAHWVCHKLEDHDKIGEKSKNTRRSTSRRKSKRMLMTMTKITTIILIIIMTKEKGGG